MTHYISLISSASLRVSALVPKELLSAYLAAPKLLPFLPTEMKRVRFIVKDDKVWALEFAL